jgi:5-methylcytosine-specific restriction endonuclease McrA
MGTYSLAHVSDDVLLRNLADIVGRDRRITAALLAHLAEVDQRRLYLGLGYSSMHAYCSREFHFSEGATYKRITAARVARRCPAAFAAIADGRLHLSGLTVLAPKLDPSNVDELIAACTHKTRAEIESILAARYPQPDVPTRFRTVGSAAATPHEAQDLCEAGSQPSALEITGIAGSRNLAPTDSSASPTSFLAPASAGTHGRLSQDCDTMAQQLSPGRVDPAHGRLKPLSADRVAMQVTIDKSTYDKLERARALLSHSVPSRDVAQVLDRALDALIARLEKRKFGAASKPRHTKPRTPRDGSRHVPAHVRRAVRARDASQCTFVADSGRRCEARARLEFDHIVPVARGGRSTTSNVRLRCRAHNQLEADRVYGAEFMRGKRRRPARAASRHAGISQTTNLGGASRSMDLGAPTHGERDLSSARPLRTSAAPS